MTIFQMKGGNVEPVAIIKAGKTTKIGASPGRHAPAAAPAMAPGRSGDGARDGAGERPKGSKARARDWSARKTASSGAPFFRRQRSLRREPASRRRGDCPRPKPTRTDPRPSP